MTLMRAGSNVYAHACVTIDAAPGHLECTPFSGSRLELGEVFGTCLVLFWMFGHFGRLNMNLLEQPVGFYYSRIKNDRG